MVGHTLGARLPVRVAVVGAMCWAPLPPFPPYMTTVGRDVRRCGCGWEDLVSVPHFAQHQRQIGHLGPTPFHNLGQTSKDFPLHFGARGVRRSSWLSGLVSNCSTSAGSRCVCGGNRWKFLRASARPPPAEIAEPGEWQHGWQRCASSSLELHFTESIVAAQSSVVNQAHLRSHPGPGARAVLCGAPTGREFVLQPGEFRTIVLKRLRLPFQITKLHCKCDGLPRPVGAAKGSLSKVLEVAISSCGT